MLDDIAINNNSEWRVVASNNQEINRIAAEGIYNTPH
jgi:hypothetical protein